MLDERVDKMAKGLFGYWGEKGTMSEFGQHVPDG
jgi:hypothetical protein